VRKKFRTFEEAKKFVHSLKLKRQKEWIEYCRSDKKPADIPSTPEKTYKNKGWNGLGDWLGTYTVATQNKKFRAFEEARNYVRNLGIKGQKEWGKYVASGKKPDDIPSNANTVYKNKGWISFGDWLGTGYIASGKRQYRPFEEARSFVHTLRLKNTDEWSKYCKLDNKPDNIPAAPWSTYKNKGWIGSGDWLGTGRTRNHRSFHEARKYVRTLGLTNYDDWGKFSKSVNRPSDIPATPDKVYKKEWKGMGDWLGTFTIPRKDRIYRPFTEARKFIYSLKLRGGEDWKKFCKSGKRPIDIPTHPHIVYKKDWISWGDWFGTGRVATNKIKDNYRKFIHARNFVHTLGLKSATEFRQHAYQYPRKIIPPDIPAHPYLVYKKEWTTWGDFLGTGRISTTKFQFRPFTEAREFVRSLNLENVKEWQQYSSSEKRPKDIPGIPANVYRNEWKGWGDFLGTGNIATNQIPYLTFSEARKFVRSLGIKNGREWKEYCKSGKKPDYIPSNPWVTYSKKNIWRIRKLNEN